MPPAPAPDARRLLHQVVTTWNALVLDLRAAGSRNLGSVLSRLVAAWQIRQPVPAPYDKHDVIPLLEDLLRVDAHISATCRDAYKVALALDVIGLEELNNIPLPERGIALEQITDFLVTKLYEEDYVRRVYFRVYNLQTDEATLQLPGDSAQLESLDDWQIPAITGEATAISTLHLRDTGNVFLVATDNGPDEDMEWWRARWQYAIGVVGVLKYLKYAVIEIDYSALQFFPDWVNQVRRYGISMWGRPRTDVQAHRYTLTREDQRTLARYLGAVVRFKPLLENLNPTLRRSIATAGNYYEGHHKRTSLEDQLIDLVIALEALFSPKEKTELRFRISHRAALLLGSGPENRRSLGRFLRKVYDARSLLVHEGTSPFIAQVGSHKQRAASLTSDDLRRVGDLVRESILRMGVLLARGEQVREEALRSIEESAYDPIGLDDLRRKTDIEGFLKENGL